LRAFDLGRRRDAAQNAALFEALLRGGIYEGALHGLVTVNPEAIDKEARLSGRTKWNLLTAD
jgi:hypothetical protein